MVQLNYPVLDLPNLVIICWILWICLFDFNVKYILGIKKTIVDGLF